jgi:serine protease Do
LASLWKQNFFDYPVIIKQQKSIMMLTLRILVIGFVAGFAGAFSFYQWVMKPEVQKILPEPVYNHAAYDSPAFTSIPSHVLPASPDADGVDFSDAARRATPSVVFINSISRGVSYSYWDWFFGEGGSNGRTQVSTGSGVIFSTDGYIVTNNHVIASAERIEVNYNKRVYPAELIGTDPSTDLAVIKIKETNLPAITLTSSKHVQVGEWVIAVGNPYTLASTVTAGIVSAKGRRIGILEDKFPIESFIQTDAAINPGNSGGALVNKSGELVGINSAILSRTGSYTGYAFAIPSDIVKKVFNDLVKYGVVQKALIGGSVIEYNYENANKYRLDTSVKSFSGVLLESVDKTGPAADAGLKPGDVITRINNTTVNTQSEFEEELSFFNPGNKITLTYLRDGKQGNTSLTLVNRNGTTEVIRRNVVTNNALGAQFEATQYGVKVFGIKDSSVLKQIGVSENFTIVAINRVRVKEPEEVIEFFQKFRGRGYIYGINAARQQMELPFTIR